MFFFYQLAVDEQAPFLFLVWNVRLYAYIFPRNCTFEMLQKPNCFNVQEGPTDGTDHLTQDYMFWDLLSNKSKQGRPGAVPQPLISIYFVLHYNIKKDDITLH